MGESENDADAPPQSVTDDAGTEKPEPESDGAREPEIADAIAKMPPPVKQMFEMFAVALTSGGPRYHPIFDKFKEKQVDKFLEDQRAEDERQHQGSSDP